MKKSIVSVVLIAVILFMFAGCGHVQMSKDKIISDFNSNKEAFDYVISYIDRFDLGSYEQNNYTDYPLYVDFIDLDFEVDDNTMSILAGYSPHSLIDSFVLNDYDADMLAKVFSLNYAYIGQVGTDNNDPLVVYFRIDDLDPERNNSTPHGVVYTSDGLSPSIDNDGEPPVYTEKIAENWFYYEDERLG